MFVNRERETDFIKEVIERPGFQLIPIWGRRRIGKTALLLHSLEKKAFYFLATESTSIDNLKRFREELSIYLNDESIRGLELDWENILRYISKKDLSIIIDEFPYLISADASIPSVFQRIIDLHLSGTDTKLFLCGSSARIMESFVLDYKAPLYGRRTGQIHLDPLKFKHLKMFFPNYSMEDLVRVFGTCGGIPLYLLQFDPEKDLWDNIESVFFNPFSIMYEEPKFLLKQEFKNIATYRSILNELTSGRTKLGKITGSLYLKRSDITPYFHNLISIGLVNREVPITEDPARSRSGIYMICDHFMRFHHTYVYPRIGLIESGNTGEVVKFLKSDLDRFLGWTFEKIVKEVFLEWSNSNRIQYHKLGRWWYKENEIDLVGLNSNRNEGICIEIKWSGKIKKITDVRRSIEKGDEVPWGNERTKWSYLYVSRGGFTENCMEWMDENEILHWDLDDISNILWNN